jgi:predicted Zn-dependent protease
MSYFIGSDYCHRGACLMTILSRLPGLIIVVISLCIVFTAGSACASFTFEDEMKLGKEFYEKLEKSQVLIQDEKVNAYINTLGQKILAQSKKVPFDFHFSIIRSSAINAFATPGGYVYVNRGLITLVEKESELAGVLAHEIAHVNARHIANIIEKSQKVSFASLAAILAGAFLGGGGELTAAVTSFSLATATTLNLKYSREHEEEADRLGLISLVSAGYNGAAMLDFLKIMRRYEFYSNSIPSYFLTHPGTDERIRYLDAAIETTYSKKGKDTVIGNLKRVQTLLMFGERNLEVSLNHFQNELKKNPKDVDALYGLAVIKAKLGKTSEALTSLQAALALSPNDEDILRDIGILYYELGKTSEAVSYLQKAMAINPEDDDVLLYLGRSYQSLTNYSAALDLFKKLERKNALSDEDVYYDIAVSYGKMNDLGNSHYNFGVFFKKKNKVDSALFHFTEALKYFSKQDDRYQEIEKDIKELSKGSRRSSAAPDPSKHR